MANFTQIIQEINDDINTNGVGAITGAKLNEVLRDMIAAVNAAKTDILPDGALYGGFVRPDEPPTYGDDYRYYYLAEETGEYIYFNRWYVDSNVIMFYYDMEAEVWRQKVLWVKNDVLDVLLSYKAGKPVSSTQGHIPNLDQYGDLQDSGIDIDDVATTADLAGKQDTISDLATIRSGAAAGATAYQKPSGGIPKTDLASGVQTSLVKADTAVQQVTVGTTTTGNAGTNASVTNSGTATNPVLDFAIPRGADAVNPFKGWYASTNALPANPVVGDYAYVKGANASDPAVIYECTTAGTWSDSGRTADTSNVQTFASGEEVNEVHIVDDLSTGSSEDVLSAKQGVVLTEDNQISLYEKSYTQKIAYELGNITIGNSWVYTSSTTRVRTPEGYILHLFPGDTIGLSSYSNARFYIGWRKLDGSYNSIGWNTSDYTVLEEGYHCILVCNLVDTVQTSAEALGSLIKVVRNTTISKRVSDLENNNYTNVIGLAEILKNRYIKYSDGSIQTTGSPIWVYNIPAKGIKKVKVFVTATDTVPAAISFYSSDVISSGTYISGVQIIGDTSGGHWFEANVPNNAVLICVTNHQSYVSNPYFLVDYLSPEVLGTEEKSVPELGIGIVYGYQKAANYDGTFSPIYTNNSYFPIESFQSRIRLTPLYGLRINIKQVGVLTIVKATGVLTENCVMTTIKAFTITKTGWQVLLFDAPVTLSEGESLGVGVKTDTAKVVVDSVYGGANAVMTDYLHYTQNIWAVYQQNLLIDVLGIPKNDAEEALKKVQSLEKKDVFAGNNPFRFNGPFYAHLFLDKIYETSTDITIPSESLDDIRVSKRLGFNVIEANVHATSDGKLVVIHGSSGKFGYEVTDLNGDFTYADTAINSVTLDWIKANIRYRSDIPRFRTAIPTFEEFLRECRLQGMIPFAQASTADMVALLDGIMGKGNYFAYNGTRALTSAPIVQYLSLTTKEAILEQARSIGVPYVYAMENYNTFTDDELKDIVSSLHSEGFMIATAYISGANADRVRKLGFDMIASSWNVNNFDNANLCTLCVGTDWSDFQITGSSATDSGVELGVGDSITPANALGTEFLAKGMLQVTFTGTIGMKCGKDDQEVTSDGVNSVIFSSYFINSAPTFMVYGNSAGATITDIVFKASKC